MSHIPANPSSPSKGGNEVLLNDLQHHPTTAMFVFEAVIWVTIIPWFRLMRLMGGHDPNPCVGPRARHGVPSSTYIALITMIHGLTCDDLPALSTPYIVKYHACLYLSLHEI